MNPLSSGNTRFVVMAAVAFFAAPTFLAFAQSGDQVLSFATVATLRAYNTSSFGSTVPQALTAGYYAAGDQGGNRFTWSSSSTAADNGGTVIKPTGISSGSPGRWLAAGNRTFNARAFGAKGDSIADDTAAINAAITEAQASGILGSVYFPRGTYTISSGIVITSPVRLIGEGAGAYPGSSPGNYSKLLWGGESSGTMLTLSHLVYNGHGIERLQLDGNGKVPTVLLIDSSSGGLYTDLVVLGTGTGSGIKLTASDITCSWNTFTNTSIEGIGNGKSCLWLTGSTTAGNACHNTFINTKLVHTGDRPAIVLGACDNNVLISTFIYRGDNSSGSGVLVDPTERSGFPVGNLFQHLQAGNGGWEQPATSPCSASIFGYQQDNGQPQPVTNGSQLNVIYDTGYASLWQAETRANAAAGPGQVAVLAKDYYSLPSYTGVVLKQYGSGATGTEFGISHVNMSLLLSQNTANLMIGTNAPAPILFGTSGTMRGILNEGLSIGDTVDPGVGVIRSTKGFRPPQLSDASAANNTIYFSLTSSKLVYKDSSGTVHVLY